MKIKVSNSEALALAMLFKSCADKYMQAIQYQHQQQCLYDAANSKPHQLQVSDEHVYLGIFQELWMKLQRKIFETKKQYTISLRPHEAAAIHVEFAGIVSLATYEGMLLHNLCNHIHKQITSAL